VISFLHRAELWIEGVTEHCSHRPTYHICEDGDVSFLKNLHSCLNQSNASSFSCNTQSIIPHYPNGFSMNAKAECSLLYYVVTLAYNKGTGVNYKVIDLPRTCKTVNAF
jgi:hypothetical protein